MSSPCVKEVEWCGLGGLGFGGVGYGEVKIISSNDIMCHAHFHPLSHNMKNKYDGKHAQNENSPSVKSKIMFVFSGGDN